MKAIGQQNLQNLCFIRIATRSPTPVKQINCTAAMTKARLLSSFKLLDPIQMSASITSKLPQITRKLFTSIRRRRAAARANSGKQPTAASPGHSSAFLPATRAACYWRSTPPTHKNFGWRIRAAPMASRFSRVQMVAPTGRTSRAVCSTMNQCSLWCT